MTGGIRSSRLWSAGQKDPFPAWYAVTVTTPPCTTRRVFPSTTATDDEPPRKLTGKPLDDVATRGMIEPVRFGIGKSTV
ncbi:MAG: hypothetical protein AB7J34_18860 [Limisphaerales bacterium]